LGWLLEKKTSLHMLQTMIERMVAQNSEISSRQGVFNALFKRQPPAPDGSDKRPAVSVAVLVGATPHPKTIFDQKSSPSWSHASANAG